MPTDHDRDAILLELGKRLRRARSDAGLSQEKLALRSSLDRTYVASAERGERNVSLINLLRLSAALGVDVGDLLAGMTAMTTD